LRYFLEIAYKGTNYHGWQVQKNAHTVQEELNSCLKTLFQKDIETVASGRTDTGVHAIQQFVHLDLDIELSEYLIFKMNCVLPKDIVVKNFFRVRDNAHARFDAILRAYEYRICRVKDPFLFESTHFFPRPLDVEKMQQAAKVLLKYEDFQSFSKVHTDVDHFLCQMKKAAWHEKGNLLLFEVEANRFLRGMVRTLVGTMLDVGQKKISVEQFEEIILKKDRKAAGAIVPAQGLYFDKIVYPDDIFI
jgi:tRNA pseudouridine38-40 synthase